MGAEKAALELRHADESDANVSHVIFNLLAGTGDFDNRGIDGRLTFRKFVTSTAMRNILASALDVPPEIIARHVRMPRLPRLAALATVASASRQPLRQVIIGQLSSWDGESRSGKYTLSGLPRRNWEVIECEFEKIANGRTFVNLRDACKILNISGVSARIHFPGLVTALVERGRVLKSKMAESRKVEMAKNIRQTFRMLVLAGEYPSISKLKEVSGVGFVEFYERYKDVVDEEWRRVDGKVMCRRIRGASR
jgi:hypothetical protein